MRKLISLTIGISLGLISNLIAIEYEDLYNNGQVAELRSEIYSQPYFDENELPRAAYYESLVTSKNFDQTLQELIEGFPEIEYKDQVNFKLGVINFFQRKYSQAEFYFSKIDNIDNFNEYNYWLARLYYMKQEHKQSSKYANMFIDKCSKLDHKYELSFYMLIENSISEINFQKAVVLAEELLMKKPEGINKAYLYYRIGYSYERLDNIDLSVENYKKSFEIDPYGQYAALTEERLFELKKGVDRNIDISFLYTKNYESETNNKPVAYKTEPKQFSVTELVRTDTSTVLSKFFNSDYNNKKEDKQTQEIIHVKPQSDFIQENKDPLYASNPQNDQYPLSKNDDSIDIPNKNLSFIDKVQEERSIESEKLQKPMNPDNGTFLERPKNIETEGYIYLMNKPVGKYFVQIGRFSQKEYAVNRSKELFYLQQTWNIFRDVRGDNITYVIWSEAFETANEAKEKITYFKSKNVDCFLVSNE